jgi:hypothetical protein
LWGLEILEDRTLLSAAVATDLVNYTPGGTALITATGFQPGETVQFQVLHTDGTANTGANEAPWQVADTSGAGNLQTGWNLDPADTGSFEVIAVGKTLGEVATCLFSDASAYTNPIVPPTSSVVTDQSDYVPGSTAVINASGFRPGETVQFQVLHTDGSSNAGTDHAPWQVTDTSGQGNVQTSWYVDPSDNAGASLRVIAIGETSGAVTTEDFTDATTTVTSVGVGSGVVSSASYGPGTVIPITVTFSAAETVTGTPRIQLNTSPTEYATYASGSGTNTLTFNYTVASGDTSTRLNYASTTALQLNGGTITNGGTSATLTLPALTATANHLYGNNNDIVGTNSTVTSLNASSKPEGSAFTLQVNGTGFVTTGTSTSTVTWTSGGTTTTLAKTSTQSATRLQVTVPALLMTDETATGAITIVVTTGGSQTFTVTDADSLTTTVQSFTPLVNTAYTNTVATVSDTYSNLATDLTATINWGDGHTTSGAVSGSGGSYTVIDHGNHVYTTPGNYSVSVTVSDDSPGTAPASTDSKNITVVAAVITDIGTNAPANSAYTTGAQIPITLTFGAPVTVDTTWGTPTLLMNVNYPPTEIATYTSGSGTNTLTFTYVVQAGDGVEPLDVTPYVRADS